MCGGGAKGPRRSTEKISAGDMRRQQEQLAAFSRDASKANEEMRSQLAGQIADSNKRASSAAAELAARKARSLELASQQIQGSYRTTTGIENKGAAMSTTQIAQRRRRLQLQIAGGDLMDPLYGTGSGLNPGV